MEQPFFISKELLLEASNGGKDLYLFVMPDLKPRDKSSFENTLNPFYHDTKPGLSIYRPIGSDRWLHKDFGEEDFQGDVFAFAALHYDLDQKIEFPLIMHRIAQDLNIPREAIEDTSYKPSLLLGNKKFDFIYPDDNYGLEYAHNYFQQFGVTREILREYGVHSFTTCRYSDKEGKLKTLSPRRSLLLKSVQLLIAYVTYNHAKIYSPDPKLFMHVGEKAVDFTFGLNQILLRNTRWFTRKIESLKPRDILIITGGEKDVLTLTALGYDAICLNSETITNVNDRTIEFFTSYDKIVVLYDNDNTGKKNSKKLAERYSLSVVELPETLREFGGKDISDYVRLGLDKDILRSLIEAAPNRIIYDAPPIDPPNQPELVETMVKTNLLPQSVYDKLPDFLKSICSHFNETHERDLVLLSTLVTLSTCFPHLRGMYDDNEVGLNLYLFITAPASSGKGVISWSRKLALKINDYLHEKYTIEYQKYLKDYKSFKEGNSDVPPDKPKDKHLIIPANISNTMLTDILYTNDRFGLIFETEADALISALKNDWGNWSYILRNVFHHEPISIARVGSKDKKYAIANYPHLSVVLSGTPDQQEKFIDGVENGFFSRFMQYIFNAPVVWKSKFGNGSRNLKSIFDNYSEQILSIWQKHENSNPVMILAHQKQVEKFDDYFNDRLTELYEANGRDIVACIYRHGLMCYRIAMVLTAIRQVAAGSELNKDMYIDDIDFNNALQIMDILLKHLEIVFIKLQDKNMTARLTPKHKMLYEHLPPAFSTSEFNSIAVANGFHIKTAEKLLRRLRNDGLIEKLEHGKYRKV